MKLATKLDTLTPSFTIGISSKVKEMKANGIDVLNLSMVNQTSQFQKKQKHTEKNH